MPDLTLSGLLRIMDDCAGSADGPDSAEELADRAFEELGYDSLAIMETAARLKQEFGVDVSDEELTSVTSARELHTLALRQLPAVL
jgi:minimal PKS acyl carrier protein